MIKKIISNIIITIFILQNIGCYSYSQIPMEDIQEMEQGDNVKIITLDEKVYCLSDVEIQGDIVCGKDKSIYPNKESKIPIEEIAKLEVEKSDSIFILIIGAIVVVAVLNTNPGSGIDLRNIGK